MICIVTYEKFRTSIMFEFVTWQFYYQLLWSNGGMKALGRDQVCCEFRYFRMKEMTR